MKGPKILEKKQNKLAMVVGGVFRRLSITVNLTVYSIYLIYLIYTIIAGIGVTALNVALAVLTAAFMCVYLVLRLSTTRRPGEIKRIKRYYKRFKMIARAVSAITAVYALLVAVDAVSPFALIVAMLGAVFMIIRLIVELVSYFIQKKIMKLTDGIRKKFARKPEGETVEGEETEDGEEQDKVRYARRKRKKGEVPKFVEEIEEKIVPIDDCLLSDIEII